MWELSIRTALIASLTTILLPQCIQNPVSFFHEQPKQSLVISSKELDRKVSRIPHSPALDHPWRTYGKKINGKPLPVPD